jgi:hypothetical protein
VEACFQGQAAAYAGRDHANVWRRETHFTAIPGYTHEAVERLVQVILSAQLCKECGILLFSLAEACLLADTVDYFEKTNMPYDPSTLCEDVQAAVDNTHRYVHSVVQHKQDAKYFAIGMLGTVLIWRGSAARALCTQLS